MMNRKDKLKKAKEQRKETSALPPTHSLSGVQLSLERGEELEKAAIELNETLKKGLDFNDLDKLLAQLSSISEVREAVEGLREAMAAFPALPEEVKVKGFNEFVDALKDIKIEAPQIPAPIVKIEKDKSTNKILQQIALAMVGFSSALKASAPKAPSQRPLDFIPYRRVIKDGNHYKFDDEPGGGGGGGGISPGGVPQSTNASNQVFVPVANTDGSSIGTGGGGGGGASTIADGADVTEGAIADAAVSAGAAGTVSAKLRRLTSDIDSIKTNTGNNATSANQTTELTRLGDVTESAPATDTASSGLNGRLQRIAQRLTSLIALVPATLSALGNFKTSLADIGGTAVDSNSGAKSAGTQRVVIATDQPALTAPLLTTPGGGVADNGVDSGNPVKVGGRYNSSNQVYADGDRADMQVDVNGFQRVTLATQLSSTQDSVTAYPFGHSFTNMTTATTTTVKSGAGVLHAIIVNTPVASATITIYDNTAGSGTTIGKITLGGTLANDMETNYPYDIAFSTGLTIVTSGATDITISYR